MACPTIVHINDASLLPSRPPSKPQASKQRLLIQNTAVQLLDAFGNAAACSGVQVRFRLRHPQQGAEQGGELPQLEEGQQGGGGRETDAQGRAFFGNLLLAQGTGGVPGWG